MSALFFKALENFKGSKNLDVVLGGSKFLDEGTYEFTVQAVDSTDIMTKNQISITYSTPEGQSYKDQAFFTSKDGTGLGIGVSNLLRGCVPGADAFSKILEVLSTDPQALDMLTGMRMQATLKRGPGFHTHALASGGYAAFDGPNPETATKLTDSFDDVKDARDAAKAAGHKQSFVRVNSVKAIAAEENFVILDKALAARGTAKPTIKVAKAI